MKFTEEKLEKALPSCWGHACCQVFRTNNLTCGDFIKLFYGSFPADDSVLTTLKRVKERLWNIDLEPKK